MNIEAGKGEQCELEESIMYLDACQRKAIIKSFWWWIQVRFTRKVINWSLSSMLKSLPTSQGKLLGPSGIAADSRAFIFALFASASLIKYVRRVSINET